MDNSKVVEIEKISMSSNDKLIIVYDGKCTREEICSIAGSINNETVTFCSSDSIKQIIILTNKK